MSNRIIQFARSLLRRKQNERELKDELRFDLESRQADLAAEGLSPEEASRRARMELGGETQVREACREVRPIALLESVVQDIRYALRTMKKNLTFSVVVILTLALGIGASTAIFTVVDGVLLRPMPFEFPAQLCVVWETDRNSGTIREPASLPDYLDYRVMSKTLADMGALMGAESTFTAQGSAPARIDRLIVSESFLPMLGIHPLLGRGISAADVEDLSSVVVLSEQFWKTRFNADLNVLGQSVQIDDEPYEIIGVLPQEAEFGIRQLMEAADYCGTFAGTSRRSVDIWTPLTNDPEILPRFTHPIFMLGRLAPTATIDAAQIEMAAIAADLEAQYPENRARGVHLEPLSDVVLGATRPSLLLLLGAVGLVLLVACVNVVNLLLARSSARSHKIAVRSALGAGGGRLARQFFVESMVMTTIATILGVGLAMEGLKVLLALAPADLPRLDSIALDVRVLGVTLVVSALVAILFGMAPTLMARRVDMRGALTASERGVVGNRSANSRRSALVVAEITFAVILVSAAGLLMRNFWSLQSVDPGYHAAGVLKAEYTLPSSRYPPRFCRVARLAGA